jgi:hypothetical protein
VALSPRQQGARALAAGLSCWAVNVALTLAFGMYGPALVILGALGVWAGAVLLLWGDSFRTMPLAQKLPAGLIAAVVVAGSGLMLLRWLDGIPTQR